MRQLGIVGGLGPESTVDYYRSLVARYRERVHDGSYPHFLINNIDLKRMVDGITSSDFQSVADLLVEAVDVLARAGADFGLISANTPHIVFDEVRARSPIPLISIVETACDAAIAADLKRVGIFGTRFTMNGRFYSDVFVRADIELIAPEFDDREWIHDKYMGELVEGVFRDETRVGLLDIVDRLRDREEIDGLLLAGTELSLILREESHNGIPILDTARIHVERAVEEMVVGLYAPRNPNRPDRS